MEACKGLIMPEPMNYIRFMSLVFNCRLVITDSGGIQEETSYLGIPCLTVRENTERPVTITHGTNQLCKLNKLIQKTDEIFNSPDRKPGNIAFWDGKTALRIVEAVKKLSGR
jgi:UDP-N-acetylglucosamine 2-epimerase (non-hydrolysing)